MLVIHVYVKVLPECIQDFKAATIENARNSLKEPGVARFDVVQRQDDPTQFILVEAYRTLEAPAQHKETEHYKRWRDTVADMMAEPRSSVKCMSVYPDDLGWG
jgi:quinol monooxygenase YgiN